MGPEFRKNRESWGQEGRVIPLTNKEYVEAVSGPEPGRQQGDYFKPGCEGEPCEVTSTEPAADFLTVEDQLRLEAALLHPSVRTRQQETLAQLVLVTRQRPKRSKKEVPQKETRAAKVDRWREGLGKMKIADRLARLVPQKGQKKHLPLPPSSRLPPCQAHV